MDDQPGKQPVVEAKREWTHGTEGLGTDCSRVLKPVYTDPWKIPDKCRRWDCDNGEWIGGKAILRDKETKKILSREGQKVGS